MPWSDIDSISSNSEIERALSHSIHAFNLITTQLDEIIEITYQATIPLNIMAQIAVHLHDSHFHFMPHDYYQFYRIHDLYGNIKETNIHYEYTRSHDIGIFRAAQMLHFESNMNYDFDGNDLIYNRDFIINPHDKNRPPEIIFMENYPGYNWHLPMIMWDEYLQTINGRFYRR